MAFEFYFDNVENIAKVEMIEQSEGSWTVISAPIGIDPEAMLTYTLSIDIAPMMAAIPAEFELSFYIVEYDEDLDYADNIFDALRARRIVHQEEHREACLMLLRTMTRIFLSERRPESIFMQTIDQNLPRKALAKYEALLDVADNCGYSVEEQEPYHGRCSWIMRRAPH